MIKFIALLLSASCLCSCSSKKKCSFLGVDKTFLDSVINSSDTFYTKTYKTSEFARAEYFVNRNNGILCQIMKSTDSMIRQIIITHNNRRIYTAEFFPNGQLKARFGFNSEGNYEGEGVFYYENGCVHYSGNFRNGLYTGEWKNFDEEGKLISSDVYNENGQLQNNIPVR